MTQQEFEELAQESVSIEQYERIETVYAFFDRWQNKKEFVSAYKQLGIVGIEILYEKFQEAEKVQREINKLNNELNKMNILYGISQKAIQSSIR